VTWDVTVLNSAISAANAVAVAGPAEIVITGDWAYVIISWIFILIVTSPFFVAALVAAFVTGRIVARRRLAIPIGGLVGLAVFWASAGATLVIVTRHVDAHGAEAFSAFMTFLSVPALPCILLIAWLGNLYRPERPAPRANR
jgi:hypothetical protein